MEWPLTQLGCLLLEEGQLDVLPQLPPILPQEGWRAGVGPHAPVLAIGALAGTAVTRWRQLKATGAFSTGNNLGVAAQVSLRNSVPERTSIVEQFRLPLPMFLKVSFSYSHNSIRMLGRLFRTLVALRRALTVRACSRSTRCPSKVRECAP